MPLMIRAKLWDTENMLFGTRSFKRIYVHRHWFFGCERIKYAGPRLPSSVISMMLAASPRPSDTKIDQLMPIVSGRGHGFL